MTDVLIWTLRKNIFACQVKIEQLEKENAMMREALEFYAVPEERKDYREAFTMARVINEDLSDYFYNGINLKISGKRAREVLAKLIKGSE